MLDDAAFWGIDLKEEDIVSEHYEGIHADNLPALQAFLAVSTQWNMVSDVDRGPRAIGLNYPAVETGLRMAGIETTPDLWADLKLIEFGARAAMNGAMS